MQILESLDSLTQFQNSLKNKTLALVPTMGALHAGHIYLVVQGLKHADVCLPYIYVNPTQFTQGEDLETYPRTLEADLEKLKATGVQAVWLPQTKDIYPGGVKATHKAGVISKPLEGAHRPHFFDGVVSVLYRMFILSKPNFVMMGEKDFQQLQVVRDMAKTLSIPLKIIGVQTERDENGLALSSRNAYLSEDEYKIAIQLNKILTQMAHYELDERMAHQEILEVGFDKIDYCTYRNAETFLQEKPNRVLAAVWLGKTRLIDNIKM